MSEELKKIFKEKGEWIRIYMGTESTVDPYEKNISVTMINPQPIRAIVTDLIASQSQWKMPGVEANKAKEIIIKKKYENTLKASQKIKIQGEFYLGWRKNGELQYRIEGDYLRAYVHLKKV